MLQDKLDGLIMEAMKNHNEVRTRTLRLIKTAFMEARTAKGASVMDEAKEVQVMNKMVKQREDARQQYIDANRIELAKNEFEEMEIIKEFLPKPVSREEIEEALNDIILNTPKEQHVMGMLIKEIKQKYPSADGKLVSEIVKGHLNV